MSKWISECAHGWYGHFGATSVDCASKRFLLTSLTGHPSAAWSMSQRALPKVHGTIFKKSFANNFNESCSQYSRWWSSFFLKKWCQKTNKIKYQSKWHICQIILFPCGFFFFFQLAVKMGLCRCMEHEIGSILGSSVWTPDIRHDDKGISKEMMLRRVRGHAPGATECQAWSWTPA